MQGLQAGGHPQMGAEPPQKRDLAVYMPGELQAEQESQAAATSLPVPGNEFEHEFKSHTPGRC